MDNLLSQKYTGPLTVTVHTIEAGKVDSVTLNFKDTTLFEYIGEACGRIFTNLTSRLTVQTSPENWKIISFSPEKQKLEVLQVSGEELKIEKDDPQGLDTISKALRGKI